MIEGEICPISTYVSRPSYTVLSSHLYRHCDSITDDITATGYVHLSQQISTPHVSCGPVFSSGTNFSKSTRTSKSYHVIRLTRVLRHRAIPRKEHVDVLTALQTRVSKHLIALLGGQATTSYRLVEYSTHPQGMSGIFPTPPLQHPAGR